MKKQIFFPLLLCLTLLVALSGCGGETPAAEVIEPTPEVTVEPVLPTSPTELCREFLEIYLTSDFEGRYAQFTAAMENITPELTQEEAEKITADYHAAIRPYISDGLYEKMCRNRDLSRWDGGAEKLGVTMTPIQISLTDYGSDFYDFTASIQLDGVHNTTAVVTGQLVMEDENTITNVTLNEYRDFPQIG